MSGTEVVLVDMQDRLGRMLALVVDYDKQDITGAWIEDSLNNHTNKRISRKNLFQALTQGENKCL